MHIKCYLTKVKQSNNTNVRWVKFKMLRVANA